MENYSNIVDPYCLTKTLKAIKVSQPIGDIIVASVSSETIQQITRVDVRRRLSEDRDIERYLGIQRPLNEARVREINKYVNFIDATFPSAVILAVDDEYASFDENSSTLTLSNFRKGEDVPSTALIGIAKVLDGQHRIRGLETFDMSEERKFDVIAAFFIGSDVADQGYIFATVNLEQTKVNKSLAIDLYGLARARSPYKICHNIAVTLDSLESSPFYRKIKRLGVADPSRLDAEGNEIGYRETITQATFVNGLIGYISKDPKSDRDTLLKGKNLIHPSHDELQRQVLRGLFVNKKDVEIGKIFEAYFDAVRKRWPEAWDFRGAGNILGKSNGYKSLAAVFGKAYLELAQPGDMVTSHQFLQLFNRVKFTSDHFTTENYKPGAIGENKLKNDLINFMGLG